MNWNPPLVEARFLRRYKRFFADVEINGQVEVAHVANTGSLKSCLAENAPCLVTRSTNPERKLKWSLQAIKPEKVWIGVNTQWPSILVEEVFKEKKIPDWQVFEALQKEVKTSQGTRLDFCFSRVDAQGAIHSHFVEVKNVTFKQGESALFPDAVTERGQKHLIELMELQKVKNTTTEILFVVQRTDVLHVSSADDIDPEYGKILRQAQAKGVKIRALQFEVHSKGITFTCELPILAKAG